MNKEEDFLDAMESGLRKQGQGYVTFKQSELTLNFVLAMVGTALVMLLIGVILHGFQVKHQIEARHAFLEYAVSNGHITQITVDPLTDELIITWADSKARIVYNLMP